MAVYTSNEFTFNGGKYYGNVEIDYVVQSPDGLNLKDHLGTGVKVYINGVLASDEALRSRQVTGDPIEFKK
ncbi:MAG: hypothetical protein HUJ80_03515 [Firmicutes bacterium]|nr:hypothetical protein [Bacillota bacterium]